MRFTLTVAGDVQMDREIEAVAAHSAQIDHVLRDIAKDLAKVTTVQFRTEGGYSGGWAPLSEAYRKRKAKLVVRGDFIHGRQARHMQIMRLTDRLRESLIYKTDPEHIETIENHVLRWGTRVPYAAPHQNPMHGQKRRRVLELPEERRQAYARAILQYMRTGSSGL